ncbi:MAG TPA: alpha/beta hydrolase [Capsulimonadaceae bacterium]|nr:alpha/beta hydrolase [Capsulimonadaceae bacterium]
MNEADLPLVHRFVPSTRPGLPTLLLLHGTGGDENDLVQIGSALLPGAALLSPRGNVREGNMARFFRRLADGVFDIEDLKARTAELARFLKDAASLYSFDPSKVIAVGYSNGANIAASLLLLSPGALSGAALFRAMVPLVPETLPDLAGAPVLLMEGRFDSLIPPDQAEALAELLRSAGAAVTLKWQEAGHGLVAGEVEAARAWLAQVVS